MHEVANTGYASHSTAIERARQMSVIVAGETCPTLFTRRERATSWTLSRLTTDSSRIPPSGPIGTSVESPRMVDVTGAAITACSRAPMGSHVSTTIRTHLVEPSEPDLGAARNGISHDSSAYRTSQSVSSRDAEPASAASSISAIVGGTRW